jgi:hypothetical protein
VPAFERRAVPNPNANTAKAITKHFFPMIEEFLLLFRRFNPTIVAKLPKISNRVDAGRSDRIEGTAPSL